MELTLHGKIFDKLPSENSIYEIFCDLIHILGMVFEKCMLICQNISHVWKEKVHHSPLLFIVL